MPKHILCADDSVTMQRVVTITFAHTDYQVSAARSVDEALALARQTRPDLVLADAIMPGKTGYDLAQAVKSDPALQRVPVVILVGNSQAYDEARGKQVGADGFLTKPWDTQVFIEKISEILSRAASQGVAQAAAAMRPQPPPVQPPPMTPQRPTMTGNLPHPGGLGSANPPPPRPPMGAPPLAGRPSAPMAAQGLPKPPAGLPRPPLIRNAPISGRPVVPGGSAAAQPIVQPAARLGDPRIGSRPMNPPPVAARPATSPHVPPPAAPPAAPPSRGPGTRQATIMGMPAVNMPPAAAHPAPAVGTPVGPPPAAPPLSYSPPPPAAPRPVAPAAAPTPPPPAARPLPGSDALARAAQRVAAAGMTATQHAAEARGLPARGVEYEAIAKLSREIIEQIAWEVVPELAEIIIRERLNELKK